MRMVKLIALLLLLVSTTNVKSADLSIPEYLQSISVKVIVGSGAGSGIAFTRKDANGKDVTFIWTAAHIFTHHDDVDIFSFLPDQQSNNFAVSTPPSPTLYADIQQIIVKDGITIVKTNKSTKLFKFSDDDNGQDLAVLKVNGPFFNTNTVVFDLSNRIPKIGEPLYSMAAPYGYWGSLSIGIYSFIGRNIDDMLFDQSTTIVFPGSSGGGLFAFNGLYEGMSNIMKASNINFITPIRRIQQWVKAEKIEWLIDPTIPMPSDKEIKKINMWDTTLTKKLESTN